jgi:hypothetical protein
MSSSGKAVSGRSRGLISVAAHATHGRLLTYREEEGTQAVHIFVPGRFVPKVIRKRLLQKLRNENHE